MPILNSFFPSSSLSMLFFYFLFLLFCVYCAFCVNSPRRFVQMAIEMEYIGARVLLFYSSILLSLCFGYYFCEKLFFSFQHARVWYV